MAILGLALTSGSVQLAWHDEQNLKEQVILLEVGQTHATLLISLIKEFLPRPPKLVATTTGPGSFTSIRIQLATAIGLKIGYGAKLFCPNTLDLLEASFEGAIPAIDSFRGDYFTKIDNATTYITPEEIDSLKVQGKKFCGDVGKKPENIASLLIGYYFKHPDPELLTAPEPYYVRTPEYKTRANYQG